MTYDGANQTFEWDAANRLVAINYTDTGNRTEFAYDGLNRRVKTTEYGPGVTAVAQPADVKYATFTTAPFTLPSGCYSLTFQGLNPNGGDNSALVDSVALNSTLVANGSFESPSVTDYQTNPTDTAWSYTASAGIAANQGTYTSDNPEAPAGDQVAFVENDGVLSQIWSASAGTYTLSFRAAQRGSGNDSYQQLRVNLRPSGSAISAKTFIWCGSQICEERDGAGGNLTKRFFAEGEQRIGGSDAGNYYYSRDHLGSIREVTDSSGTLKAQYDYDAWGKSAVLSGNMTVDFGYTGHFYHQPSGLNLALYRAYSPALGRWISRDPIGEEGGVNLYGYVENNPLNAIDLLGLAPNMGGVTSLYHVLNQLNRGIALSQLSANHATNADRYFYTDRYGWVDIRHFGEAASRAQSGQAGWWIQTLGFGNELEQWLFEWGNDYRSGFSSEDLSSNAAGVNFGKSICPGESLSDAFSRWAAKSGARSPLDPVAGFWNLPLTDPSIR